MSAFDALDGSSTQHVSGRSSPMGASEDAIMQAVTTIGADIAKAVFQIHGAASLHSSPIAAPQNKSNKLRAVKCRMLTSDGGSSFNKWVGLFVIADTTRPTRVGA